MEKISFQTSDSVTIYGDWALPSGAAAAVLLLHMMPATRISWLPLSRELNEAGFATLAIDLRGHGESVTRDQGSGMRDQLDYKNFTDKEHQASRLDVDAAVNFLKQKGFAENSILFVGASIGANLALDALTRYSSATHAILLSPGLDYRGVKTDSAMRGLGTNQKVWIVAAESDTYSADSTRELEKLRPNETKITVFPGLEHGTNLFSAQPNLIPKIVQFLLK